MLKKILGKEEPKKEAPKPKGSNLISNGHERWNRIAEKEEVLLDLLDTELCTTSELFALKLGCSLRNAQAYLNREHEKGRLSKHPIKIGVGRPIIVWGLNTLGREAIDIGKDLDEEAPIDYDEKRDAAIYRPLSASGLYHKLELQRFRIFLESKRYKNWIPERLMENRFSEKRKRWKYYPDALCLTPKSLKVAAVELERSAKTPKRYLEILNHHYENIKAGRYQFVLYHSPESKIRRRLQRIFEDMINNKGKVYSYWDPKEEETTYYTKEQTLELFLFTDNEELQ